MAWNAECSVAKRVEYLWPPPSLIRKVWTRSWGEEVQDTDQGDKGNFAKRIRTALPLEELVHWDDRKTLKINIIGNYIIYITATILTLILVVDVSWTQQQNECRRLIDYVLFVEWGRSIGNEYGSKAKVEFAYAARPVGTEVIDASRWFRYPNKIIKRPGK